MRPWGRALQPGSAGRPPAQSCPPSPEAGALLRGPGPHGAAGGGDSGRPRRSESRVGAGGRHSAGRGWGGEAGARRGGDRKGPPRRGGARRAAGGGYRPRTPRRRALSSRRTHSPPPYTPPLMAAVGAIPTTKAPGRRDCDGRDCGSREALASDPFNFHRHPPRATKRRPHTPVRSHTCCLFLPANRGGPGSPAPNHSEAVLQPGLGAASSTNRRQSWGRGEGKATEGGKELSLGAGGGGAAGVGGRLGRWELNGEGESLGGVSRGVAGRGGALGNR